MKNTAKTLGAYLLLFLFIVITGKTYGAVLRVNNATDFPVKVTLVSSPVAGNPSFAVPAHTVYEFKWTHSGWGASFVAGIRYSPYASYDFASMDANQGDKLYVWSLLQAKNLDGSPHMDSGLPIFQTFTESQEMDELTDEQVAIAFGWGVGMILVMGLYRSARRLFNGADENLSN